MDDESFSTVARARLRRAGITLQTQVKILGGFVLLFWLLEGVDWVLGGALDYYGVIPRTAVGLRGILFGLFLHGNFAHLAANTVPFLILGWLVLLNGTRVFWWVTGITAVISGLGIWLFGATRSVHLGASGLIFGYFGFLLLRGFFERSPGAILGSLVVGIAYGGILWGVLPLEAGVSWQAHLFGFLGGCLAAYWLRKPVSGNQ